MIEKKDIVEKQLVSINHGEDYPLFYGMIKNVKPSGRKHANDENELQFDILIFMTSNTIDGICQESDYCNEYLTVVDKNKVINDFRTRYKFEHALLQDRLKEKIIL